MHHGFFIHLINPLEEVPVATAGQGYSSHKSSATHSYRCMQYFRVSKHWCGCHCQCLGFLSCARLLMLMHAIAQGVCTNTVKESALQVGCGRKNPLLHLGIEPSSVLPLAFQSNALPTEPSRPAYKCLVRLSAAVLYCVGGPCM